MGLWEGCARRNGFVCRSVRGRNKSSEVSFDGTLQFGVGIAV